jgi:hypothetical protein
MSLLAPVEISPGTASPHPAAQQRHDLIFHILLGEVGPVLLRQGDGHAAGLASGDDADLGDGVVVRQGVHHHRMARLVIGGQLPLVLRITRLFFSGPAITLISASFRSPW